MTNPLITLNEYLQKKQIFLIPYYQRGYIWGKSRGAEKNSVRYFIESILNCFENKADLFLQGITVCHTEGQIEIIDGQQRTTTIYLFLKYLGYRGDFNISYSVRKESDSFLKALKGKTREEILALCLENPSEELQDIYYFKKTIREIDELVKDKDHDQLLGFLTDSPFIKFLYIEVPKNKALSIFTMMNGNKANMQMGEIIKAELLRLVSTSDSQMEDLQAEERDARKWDENMTRSKYAREWDKWQAWWNITEVRRFYHTDSVMGLFMEVYFHSKHPKCEYNFDNFRDRLLRGSDNKLCAKNTFYGLRQLQKRFEDAYIKTDLHNKIGAILIMFDKNDRRKFILDYFTNEQSIDLDHIYKYAFTQMSLAAILDNDLVKINEVKTELIEVLENEELYKKNNYHAYAQLLRRNIDADSKLDRRFDFRIWAEKSLEHIEPQSKSGSNGIGNLVLLYKNENSGFGDKSFSDKKKIYFELTSGWKLRSRHLLHSISVFAKDKWDDQEIENNKIDMINEVKTYYGI